MYVSRKSGNKIGRIVFLRGNHNILARSFDTRRGTCALARHDLPFFSVPQPFGESHEVEVEFKSRKHSLSWRSRTLHGRKDIGWDDWDLGPGG